jgi:hypothetical protein
LALVGLLPLELGAADHVGHGVLLAAVHGLRWCLGAVVGCEGRRGEQ